VAAEVKQALQHDFSRYRFLSGLDHVFETVPTYQANLRQRGAAL
jgi:hypothetical protein